MGGKEVGGRSEAVEVNSQGMGSKMKASTRNAPKLTHAAGIGFWRIFNAYILLIGGYPWELIKIMEGR